MAGRSPRRRWTCGATAASSATTRPNWSSRFAPARPSASSRRRSTPRARCCLRAAAVRCPAPRSAARWRPACPGPRGLGRLGPRHRAGCATHQWQGERLHFGGQVMKNVAGYDVSRLRPGSWVPGRAHRGVSEGAAASRGPLRACGFEMGREAAAEDDSRHGAGKPLPSAPRSTTASASSCASRAASGPVEAARRQLGGEESPGARLGPSCATSSCLSSPTTRRSGACPCPATAAHSSCPATRCSTGAARRVWLSPTPAPTGPRGCRGSRRPRELLHARRRRGPLHPLPETLKRYHCQLKAQLDPRSIFNPGRMYHWL